MGILRNLFHTRFYSVINDDHAQMFVMLKEINKVICGQAPDYNDRFSRSERVEILMSDLIKASISHFFREEALMKAFSFPEFTQHRTEHKCLIASIQSFQHNVIRGGGPITEATINYLRGWVVNHINSADRRLDSYLHAYCGPITAEALTQAEWAGLSPHEVNLTAKGLSLWAALNFFKSPIGASQGSFKYVSSDDAEVASRLRRIGQPKSKSKPRMISKKRETTIEDYHGYYYGLK